jgi:hypothetical protein
MGTGSSSASTTTAVFGFAEIIAGSFAHKKVKPSQLNFQPQTGGSLVLRPEKISNLQFNKNAIRGQNWKSHNQFCGQTCSQLFLQNRITLTTTIASESNPPAIAVRRLIVFV